VGGELGGTQKGRTISAVALTSLWLVYVLLSICQAFNIGGIGNKTYGIDKSSGNPNPKCVKA